MQTLFTTVVAETRTRVEKTLSYTGIAGTAAVLLSPTFAFAQFAPNNPLWALATNILTFINNILIPLLIAAALVVFFYGVVKYILGGEKTSIKTIQNGVIGLVVMLCIWGIVAFIGGSIGITGSAQFTTPKIGQ